MKQTWRSTCPGGTKINEKWVQFGRYNMFTIQAFNHQLGVKPPNGPGLLPNLIKCYDKYSTFVQQEQYD